MEDIYFIGFCIGFCIFVVVTLGIAFSCLMGMRADESKLREKYGDDNRLLL